MSIADESGKEFKAELLAGTPKMGLFLNSGSATVAEQLSTCGYDWLLVDTQHGPMNPENLQYMLAAIHCGKAKSMVRVKSPTDFEGIQTALDSGADGILVPVVCTADEVKKAIAACKYPTEGTRSVYFPQRSTNKKGLLGYVGNANKNVIVAVQCETAACVDNLEEIASLPGLDMMLLGQNDLCMSLGLYEKYDFPLMYTSSELNAATDKLIKNCQNNKKILGIFLFGTDRVEEFLKKGFTFIAIGNDLHHIMTQAETHMKAFEAAATGASKVWKAPE